MLCQLLSHQLAALVCLDFKNFTIDSKVVQACRISSARAISKGDHWRSVAA